jgi:hypothetical protein
LWLVEGLGSTKGLGMTLANVGEALDLPMPPAPVSDAMTADLGNGLDCALFSRREILFHQK